MWRDPDEVPLVKESQRDETDINRIMARFKNGGELQHINKAMGQYGDFSSGEDFTAAYTAVAKAEAAFARLPAYARDMMGNDPEVFLHRCSDPEYLKKFERLELYDPEAGPIVEEPKSPPVLEQQPAAGVPDTTRATPPGTQIPAGKAGSVMGGE